MILRLPLLIAASLSSTWAHTVITYPGWRGNNLHTTGTKPQYNPSTPGVDFNSSTGEYEFPFGQQWIYPCGGMPLSNNRTKWPYNGGALSIQPGWFPGHSRALIYVNIGIQEPGKLNPPNMTHNIVPAFQLIGPNNSYYQGEFCLPEVRLPADLSLTKGDNITIQVIESAQHGAALYNCVDVTLTDPDDPELEEVTPQNCHNSSNFRFQTVYSTESLRSRNSAVALAFDPGLALGSTLLTLAAMFSLI